MKIINLECNLFTSFAHLKTKEERIVACHCKFKKSVFDLKKIEKDFQLELIPNPRPETLREKRFRSRNSNENSFP